MVSKRNPCLAVITTTIGILYLSRQVFAFSINQRTCFPRVKLNNLPRAVTSKRTSSTILHKSNDALRVTTELRYKVEEDYEDSRTESLAYYLEESIVKDDTLSIIDAALMLEDDMLSIVEDDTLSVVKDDTLSIVEDDTFLNIWTARGLLLVVAVLWGTNFASVKYLMNLCFHPPCNHPPSEAALARFGVAALISLPFLFGRNLGLIMGGLECGLWITLGYFSQAIALETISSSQCAFLCSLTVVVVPLLTSIVTKKPPKVISLVSAALAIGGVGILEGLVDINSILPQAANALSEVGLVTSTAASGVASSSGEISLVAASGLDKVAASLGVAGGDLIALLQSLGFGISFMRIEHYVEKYEDEENSILTLAAAECVAVGLCSLLWVLYDFRGHIPDMSYMIEPHRLGAIAWTGIMTTVVAIYLEGIALQKATATDAALIFASEPVWASLFGAWLLHENLGLNSYVGGAVIMMACLVSSVPDLLAGKQNTEEISKQGVI